MKGPYVPPGQEKVPDGPVIWQRSRWERPTSPQRPTSPRSGGTHYYGLNQVPEPVPDLYATRRSAGLTVGTATARPSTSTGGAGAPAASGVTAWRPQHPSTAGYSRRDYASLTASLDSGLPTLSSRGGAPYHAAAGPGPASPGNADGSRPTTPSYTMHYLGIAKGELGVLSKKQARKGRRAVPERAGATQHVYSKPCWRSWGGAHQQPAA